MHLFLLIINDDITLNKWTINYRSKMQTDLLDYKNIAFPSQLCLFFINNDLNLFKKKLKDENQAYIIFLKFCVVNFNLSIDAK